MTPVKGLSYADPIARRPGLLLVILTILVGLTACGQGEHRPSPPGPVAGRLLMQGEHALKQGEYSLALALADSAARQAPGAVEPDFLKGMIHSSLLEWDEAEAAYRRVIDRDPDYRGVWNNLGNNALRRAMYQQALAYYHRELERHPAPAPWHAVGRAYRELGRIDSASYAFEQAIALDSAYVGAYLSYAQTLEQEGAYEQALALAEQALALAPREPEVQYTLASLLLRLDRTEEAIPHLEAVTHAWPWHNESHYKLAQALTRTGRAEEGRAILAHAEMLWERQAAVAAQQKSVAGDPDNPYTHAALGTALRLAGRYDEAVAAYKIALTLAPKNLEFQNNLASLYFLQRDTTAAIVTYRHMLEEDPTTTEAWLNLGVLYVLSGQRDAARQAWRQVLAHDPGNEAARAYLARLESDS